MGTRCLMIILLAGILKIRGFTEEELLPRPRNVIGVPAYSPQDNYPGAMESLEKLQYRGNIEGSPFFYEKSSGAAIENRVRYLKGQDMYVDPDPNFTKTNEEISEELTEVQEK